MSVTEKVFKPELLLMCMAILCEMFVVCDAVSCTYILGNH